MWIDELPVYIFGLAQARTGVLPVLGGAGLTLAAAVRDGRRRAALNERLHELRRPLQALALAGPAEIGPGGGALEMATAALARLDREINGADGAEIRSLIAARPLVEEARRRWQGQAALRGATLRVRWDAGEAALEGDRYALAAALDNLVANALEHGGPRIELAADRLGGRICLAVVDSGARGRRHARGRVALQGSAAPRRRPRLRAPFSRFSGKARHGHGLRLVRRTAAAHRGTFALHRGEHGTSAVLELPLAARPERAR